MCDFKPGDEVVCLKDGPIDNIPHVGNLVRGRIYTVVRVGPYPAAAWYPDIPLSVWVDGAINYDPNWPSLGDMGFNPVRFRKVQKRNDRLTIEAFSVIKDGQYEEPRKTAPAKKREKAQ